MKRKERWEEYIESNKTRWMLRVKEYIFDYLIHLTENAYFERYYLKEDEIYYWSYIKDGEPKGEEIAFIDSNEEWEYFEDLLEWKYQSLFGKKK